MSTELPSGWTKANFSDSVRITMGQSPPSSTYNKREEGLPFFQGKAEFGKLCPKATQFCSQPKKIADPDDILVSVRAPVGPTNMCRETSCIGRGLAALKPRGDTLSKYLFYFMRNIEPWLSNQGTGSTFTAISKRNLEEIEFLLAPANEQRCIVAKLEKLLAKADKCKERLEKIPIILKRFRQSVLAAACSGELTKDWRQKNRPASEAKEILKEIENEKLSEARSSAEKKQIKALFFRQETSDSNELPEIWAYVFLNKLCNSFQYGTSKKSDPDGEIPVLRMGNIQNGEIDWGNLVFSSSEEDITKYHLEKGDVVFNRTNSPELVGKTAIYRGEQPAIFAGYLIRIKASPVLNPEYLNLCLNTQFAREFCRRVKTDGVSQSNINAQKIGQFEIPFCSLQEQTLIVGRVMALFDVANKIEERYEKTKRYVNQLTQSILAKAFRGELAPQDPNDEPASELLKRIKEEREQSRT